MAFSQEGSALAKPLTSFLVLVSMSPFMYDIAFAASASAVFESSEFVFGAR